MVEFRIPKERRLSSPLIIVAMLIVGAMPTSAAQTAKDRAPQVFRVDARQLAETRRRVQAGDKNLVAATEKLERDARAALDVAPLSVVDKPAMPPSGDKHDYMSQAPYFWPNPDTANHLPYVRRDGERNPEIEKIPDHQSFNKLMSVTETLALAYYFKRNEAYAAKATQLLRAWFLNPQTRMNPHLNYGQAIPGINQGRGIGIIETSGLPKLVDAIGLLDGSKAWTKADQEGIQAWFEKYLQWLLNSGHGRDEAAQKNNHGTYYDVQVASFALFTGNRDLAAKVLRESSERRIAAQIEPDGRQPLELARTRAWSYSVGNLSGFFALAALGENVGLDLWHYETKDGRSIRKALDWLIPFATGEKKWGHQQITRWMPADLVPLLRQAALKYRDRKYEDLIAKLSGVAPEDRINLLYSSSANEKTP